MAGFRREKIFQGHQHRITPLPNPVVTNAQGFGVLKIKGEVGYKQPPQVYLPGTSLALQVSSQTPLSQRVFNQLKAGFEKVISQDRRLKMVADNPETIISFTMLDEDVSSGWETRTRSEYRVIATRTARNPTTETDETITDYGWVDLSYRALVFDGRMIVHYEAREAQTGLVINSDRLPITYSQDFENGVGAPDDEFIRGELGRLAGEAVAARFVHRPGWFSVELPKGKLKRATELFKNGFWQQSMDLLEAMPPLKNQKDDSYRLYSLGVVYEAMAFLSTDLATITKFLMQSASSYRKATELKPGEDKFWEPRLRAETVLAQYINLTVQLRDFEERKKNFIAAQINKDPLAKPDQQPQAATPSGVSARQVSTPVVPQTVTNDTIISLVKSGMDERYIIASIKHAQNARFDLSPPEQARLKQSGVSNRIIQAMRDSQMPKRYNTTTRALIQTGLILWPYLLRFF